ncbi:MAG: hypothetical protein EZS28_045191, partial [Streblomastix strix]
EDALNIIRPPILKDANYKQISKGKQVILQEILEVDEENRKSILIQQGIDPDGEEGRRIFNEGTLMRKKSGFLTRGFYGQSTMQKLLYGQDNLLKGEAETQDPQLRLSKNLKNRELIVTHVKNQVTIQPL